MNILERIVLWIAQTTSSEVAQLDEARELANDAAGEIEALTARLAAAEAEIDRLNQMLRATGYGQGQIDAYADECEARELAVERLAAAEAAAAESRRIMDLAVGRTEETLARLLFDANTERIAAVEAARTLFDDLSQFTRTEWLLKRWPWLAEEANGVQGCPLGKSNEDLASQHGQ